MKTLPDGHHAYLICGHSTSIVEGLRTLIACELQAPIESHPDIFIMEESMLSIDHAHLLMKELGRRPVLHSKKYAIVSFSKISRDAQNALLKITEEPGDSVVLFFVSPRKDILLPTLLSRLSHVDHKPGSFTEEVSFDAVSFMQDSLKDRLKKVDVFMKNLKEEKITVGDIHVFIDAIEAECAKEVFVYKDSLAKIYSLKKYLSDTGASLKILLETIALVIPCKK